MPRTSEGQSVFIPEQTRSVSTPEITLFATKSSEKSVSQKEAEKTHLPHLSPFEAAIVLHYVTKPTIRPILERFQVQAPSDLLLEKADTVIDEFTKDLPETEVRGLADKTRLGAFANLLIIGDLQRKQSVVDKWLSKQKKDLDKTMYTVLEEAVLLARQLQINSSHEKSKPLNEIYNQIDVEHRKNQKLIDGRGNRDTH